MSNPIPPFISPGAAYDVEAGQTYTGVVEGSLTILAGGEVIDSLISAGGVETVHDYGSLDSGSVIDSGGFDYVYMGGLESAVTVSAGGTLIIEGGIAAGSLINGGSALVQGGSTLSDTTITSGGVVQPRSTTPAAG
jgi:autotransporter passenger strand-loop-strand repeat protein